MKYTENIFIFSVFFKYLLNMKNRDNIFTNSRFILKIQNKGVEKNVEHNDKHNPIYYFSVFSK